MSNLPPGGPAITWTCHICGEERPNERISVRTHDVSGRFDFPPGTLSENVRYCNDRDDCERASHSSRLCFSGNAWRERGVW